jgi:hypothetical protein
LQDLIKTISNQGKDASALVAAAAQGRQLVAEGKPQEAEAALDKVLTVDDDEKK